MELLRNFDVANQYFDLASNSIITSSSHQKIKGWYKSVNGIKSAILIINNSLYFLWGDEKYYLSSTAFIKLEETSSSNVKAFKIFNENNLILEFKYEFGNEFSGIAPFEYIDNEDFDWGYFVSRIVNNETRKRNFIDILLTS